MRKYKNVLLELHNLEVSEVFVMFPNSVRVGEGGGGGREEGRGRREREG